MRVLSTIWSQSILGGRGCLASHTSVIGDPEGVWLKFNRLPWGCIQAPCWNSPQLTFWMQSTLIDISISSNCSKTTFGTSADANTFLRELFLQCLPADVHMVFIPVSSDALDKLANMADKIIAVSIPSIVRRALTLLWPHSSLWK